MEYYKAPAAAQGQHRTFLSEWPQDEWERYQGWHWEQFTGPGQLSLRVRAPPQQQETGKEKAPAKKKKRASATHNEEQTTLLEKLGLVLLGQQALTSTAVALRRYAKDPQNEVLPALGVLGLHVEGLDESPSQQGAVSASASSTVGDNYRRKLGRASDGLAGAGLDPQEAGAWNKRLQLDRLALQPATTSTNATGPGGPKKKKMSKVVQADAPAFGVNEREGLGGVASDEESPSTFHVLTTPRPNAKGTPDDRLRQAPRDLSSRANLAEQLASGEKAERQRERKRMSSRKKARDKSGATPAGEDATGEDA